MNKAEFNDLVTAYLLEEKDTCLSELMSRDIKINSVRRPYLYGRLDTIEEILILFAKSIERLK